MDDSDADALASQFLRSDYAGRMYAGWSLDLRLTGFLRRQGLAAIGRDGDSCDLLLTRVMANISTVPRQDS